MYVVATAGHVDHGKSTLVRALTGMEPDRWAEERRRGMTIDLGYAWTTLPTGETLAFVDVPGHQRFIGNMLAGLGPAPAVLFVVAADEGWRRQSDEHLAAIDALRLTHGLLAVTRCDLADPAAVLADARHRLMLSGLGDVDGVAVSGVTGAGLDGLRAALSGLARRLPAPDVTGRVRLWVDRCFTIRGSGTVVTGTLGTGAVAVGDELELRGRAIHIRGLQCLAEEVQQVDAVARVAVNLRGLPRGAVRRGDALLTPGVWAHPGVVDVRLSPAPRSLPTELTLHVGSAAVPVRVRPLDGDIARLTLVHALPLAAGDRGILRDPGRQLILAGIQVLDVDPPTLRRRGAARQRAGDLAAGRAPLADQLSRRGAASRTELAGLGVPVDDLADVRQIGAWVVDPTRWNRWITQLVALVDAHAATSPLQPGLPTEAARRTLGIPDLTLMYQLAAGAGLEHVKGRIQRPGTTASLGTAEAAVRVLERQLREHPFAAPERPDLDGLGLGPREIAAAVGIGRLLRLTDDVLLLPDGPAKALGILATVAQPFTTSTARQVLGTTRRVAIPLLEHLDALGQTERLDGGHRRVSSTQSA